MKNIIAGLDGGAARLFWRMIMANLRKERQGDRPAIKVIRIGSDSSWPGGKLTVSFG